MYINRNKENPQIVFCILYFQYISYFSIQIRSIPNMQRSNVY